MQAVSSEPLFRSLLSAELLAFVVTRLFPQTLLIGGGRHALGFFYDFVFKQPLLESLIALIEVELRALVKEGLPVRWQSMMRENAANFFHHYHQPLLANRVGESPSNIVELIQIDNFYGFCPVLPFSSTGESGQIKLLAYEERAIEGLEKGERGGRLIGTSQATGKDLKHFLKNYTLLFKRKDHRQLGPELNFFHFSDEKEGKEVCWHSKGVKFQRILLNWLEKRFSENTLFISTPLLQRVADSSKEEASFSSFEFDNERYQLRSSLLKGHLEELKREFSLGAVLPIRLAEIASVYRAVLETERWGVLSSTHQTVVQQTCVCLKEQSRFELISSLHFIEEIIKIFGFEARWVYLPAIEKKNREIGLQQVVEENPFFYPCFSVSEQQVKGASCCLKLCVQDCLGREWPISLIEMKKGWVSESKGRESFVLISQQVLCSLERFIALLIEKTEGNIPLWMAPEQVRLLVIGESALPEAKKVFQLLREKQIRACLDERANKLNERIYEAEKERVPYLLLFGEEERKRSKLRLRSREKVGSQQGEWVDLEEVLIRITKDAYVP